VVQADPLLNETLARQGGITGLNADRGTGADAIEQLGAVVDRLHAELRQQLSVEGARRIKLAHCQDDVGHPVNVNLHC